MGIKKIKHFSVNVYLKDGYKFEGKEIFDMKCLVEPKIISGFLVIKDQYDYTCSFSLERIGFFSYAPVFEG